VYSNLSHSRKVKKDAEVRKHAQYLASLPKNPMKRFFYRLQPKNIAQYWFSKRGAIKALKILGVILLLLCLLVGGLFAYFRKDLDSISPSQLAKSVQTTVTTYLDRNGSVLWQDTGTGDYKLVVDDSGLSKYLKQATVAIEDRNFYTEGGISFSGLTRAVVNNVTGGSTQGGSTLTQQLVKQVFFADEAQKRGLSGIPRKIKEVILAIEVERMYSKNQILDLYLNESPYGGRRNGVESAAQTYFGKTAKDLTIPEAALLAAIPQNPSVYNPYNVAGNKALVARQHTVLDNMAEQGYITKTQAAAAKAYPILDHILPESSQYSNIRAPHFVQMVRAELINELGSSVVGKGGLTVTTTLDLRIQTKLEDSITSLFNSYVPNWAGFDDAAATVEDTQTGQIVALVGSRGFDYPGYGQDNAAIAYLHPGSSIKALVYAKLFEKKTTGMNYGSGSTLNDENVDSIYGAPLLNSDHKFDGPVTIRSALATSRNIPAVEAMYISGVKSTIDFIHSAGVTSYCTQGDDTQVGLAAAIGGCGLKQTDLVNGYATIGRLGVYKPQTIILKVTNNSGEVLKKWVDTTGTQVMDPQSAYIVSDILSDDNARIPLDGYHATGMYIPGVKTATKTGTSDKGGQSQDIWMVSYSPALTMGVWFGNTDATLLKVGTSAMPGPIIAAVMTYAHEDVYASEGLWKTGDWLTKPSGIQSINNELYPSWWNKNQGQTTTQLAFDKVSKMKATDYTPDGAKVQLDVTQTTDPITKKPIYTAVDTSYNATKDDNIHLSTDTKPIVAVDVKSPTSTTSHDFVVTATVTPGTGSGDRSITGVQITINGTSYAALLSTPGVYTYTYTATSSDSKLVVSATATDGVYYTGTGTADSTITYNP
jgi:penicillin-binding protein 1A